MECNPSNFQPCTGVRRILQTPQYPPPQSYDELMRITNCLIRAIDANRRKREEDEN